MYTLDKFNSEKEKYEMHRDTVFTASSFYYYSLSLMSYLGG